MSVPLLRRPLRWLAFPTVILAGLLPYLPAAEAPVTSVAAIAATVGQTFSYQIATSPAGTSYTNTGGNAPVGIIPTTGLVTGTFAGAGTFSFTALNASGASAVTTVTVTAIAGSTGGDTVATYAGTYTGIVFQIQSAITFVLGGASYSTVITPAGAVTTTITNAGASTPLTGTINAGGAISFTGGTGALIYRITGGTVVASGVRWVFSTPLTNASYVLQNSTTFAANTTGGGTTTVTRATINLVGYRNKVGGVYQFTVAGSARGAV